MSSTHHPTPHLPSFSRLGLAVPPSCNPRTQEQESKPPTMSVSCRLLAELVFLATSHERVRSKHLLQCRFIRLFLLNLLRLICLFTLKVAQHQLPKCYQLFHLLFG